MQGASAPGEIISALDQIAKRCDEFDMVVIIRGGGSVQDLSCFDDYELSANIAQFPLPVITGIGHDHDVHIADLVAWRGLKTPTAVAGFIIEMFSAEEQQLAYLLQRLSMAIRERGAEELSALEKLEMKIYSGAKERLASEIYRVDLLSQKAESGNPLTLLRRGYAVPVVKGKRINSVDGIEEGGMIKIIMADGEVECKIEKIKRYEDKG
jgi:exodeoxyribonuclease VII large subunit